MAKQESRFDCEGEVPAPDDAVALAPLAAGKGAAPFATAAFARQRIRRRALADALLLALAVAAVPALAAAPALAAGPMQALLGTVAAGGVAILVYIARRSQDLERFAQTLRSREARFQAHGIPLAAWHGGEALPPWSARTGSARTGSARTEDPLDQRV